MNGFKYSTGACTYVTTDGALLVLIPAGIKTKSELLACLATGLNFPAYFGQNWDALDECLADLSWISQKRVILHHGDLPLSDNAAELRNYLQVLNGVISKPGEIALEAVFPEDCRKKIDAAVKFAGPTANG